MHQALKQTSLPEAPRSEFSVGFTVVSLRVLCQQTRVDDRPIPDRKGCHRKGSEGGIVEGCRDAIQQSLPAEPAENLVEEEHESEADVLVEGVLDQAGEAIGRQAAMHQQQSQKKSARA